jgi:hypothetical protein
VEGIKTHSTIPHEIVCLTDLKPEKFKEIPVKVIPLENDWPGWWSKMEVFRPGLFDGPVVYLDLDTVLVGNIDKLFRRSFRFAMLEPFHPRLKYGKWASGIMAWNGDYSGIYKQFKAGFVRAQRGPDQASIVQYLSFQPESINKEFGKGIYSYKRHCMRKGLPADAKIICFHGTPRPHQVKEPWVGFQKEKQ